jgi:hypothetical protein
MATIKSGGRVGKKYFYVYETGEVTSSNDPEIQVGSNVYDDGIKSDIRRPEERPTDTDENVNRIRGVVDSLGRRNKRMHPTDIMQSLLLALDESDGIPQVDKYYTYIYNAKTPGIRYDQHPLVLVTNVYSEGFTAFSLHWRMMRKYTYPEIASSLYEVYPSEISDALRLPTAYYKINN